MAAGRILVTIHTARPNTDWKMGRAILGAFCEPDPNLAPESLSIWSTQHGAFTDVLSCAPLWAVAAESRIADKRWTVRLGLGWRRTHRPQYQAKISNHTISASDGGPQEGCLMVHAPFHKGTDWAALFIRLCAAMEANEACLSTHVKAGVNSVMVVLPGSGDYAGVGSMIALPRARVTPHHLHQITAAGFGVTVQQTCVIIALLPDLAAAQVDIPALTARQARLAAILNDGTWTPPKRTSWWNDR